MRIELINDDCLNYMKKMPDNSVDTVITDPPAGISFMGKEWDNDKGGRDKWIEWLGSVMKECFRVSKPGATALVWAIPRTSHWTALGLEAGGWKIKDCIYYLFGSGFPKATDISKQLDKGHEREVIGKRKGTYADIRRDKDTGVAELHGGIAVGKKRIESLITVPTTPQAKLWNGWKSHGLKPAVECWWVAMKPNEGSYAENALKHGVAGLNIDGGRIGTETIKSRGGRKEVVSGDTRVGKALGMNAPHEPLNTEHQGRFPANSILDEEAAKELDRQSGVSKGGKAGLSGFGRKKTIGGNGKYHGGVGMPTYNQGGQGGASRFFKIVNISKEDLWNCVNVETAEKLLKVMEQIIENTAQENAMAWQKVKQSLIVNCVERKLENMSIYIALVLAAIKNLGSKKEELKVIQDSIKECEKCTQLLNLVLSVETKENTDIIQTTQNLLRLCGYANPVIINNIPETKKSGLTRFVYTPKASKRERNRGCEDREPVKVSDGRQKEADNAYQRGKTLRVNSHPTVKPLKLMEYLCRLTKTPTGGTVLDPFMGSGTTGMACKLTGRDFIGIEKNKEYFDIAKRRIESVQESMF
jgi:site-specific DNA-methyltransferase (adenine-specific)